MGKDEVGVYGDKGKEVVKRGSGEGRLEISGGDEWGVMVVEKK